MQQARVRTSRLQPGQKSVADNPSTFNGSRVDLLLPKTEVDRDKPLSDCRGAAPPPPPSFLPPSGDRFQRLIRSCGSSESRFDVSARDTPTYTRTMRQRDFLKILYVGGLCNIRMPGSIFFPPVCEQDSGMQRRLSSLLPVDLARPKRFQGLLLLSAISLQDRR